jgi:hypothetical protein
MRLDDLDSFPPEGHGHDLEGLGTLAARRQQDRPSTPTHKDLGMLVPARRQEDTRWRQRIRRNYQVSQTRQPSFRVVQGHRLNFLPGISRERPEVPAVARPFASLDKLRL